MVFSFQKIKTIFSHCHWIRNLLNLVAKHWWHEGRSKIGKTTTERSTNILVKQRAPTKVLGSRWFDEHERRYYYRLNFVCTAVCSGLIMLVFKWAAALLSNISRRTRLTLVSFTFIDQGNFYATNVHLSLNSIHFAIPNTLLPSRQYHIERVRIISIQQHIFIKYSPFCSIYFPTAPRVVVWK